MIFYALSLYYVMSVGIMLVLWHHWGNYSCTVTSLRALSLRIRKTTIITSLSCSDLAAKGDQDELGPHYKFCCGPHGCLLFPIPRFSAAVKHRKGPLCKDSIWAPCPPIAFYGAPHSRPVCKFLAVVPISLVDPIDMRKSKGAGRCTQCLDFEYRLMLYIMYKKLVQGKR